MTSVSSGIVLPVRRRKPFMLLLIQLSAVVMGSGWAIASLGRIANPASYLNIENDSLMSFANVLFVSVLFQAACGIYVLAIAVGIWREQKWARSLIVAFPASMYAAQLLSTLPFSRPSSTELVLSTVVYAVCTLVAWSMVYLIPSVRNYYDSLDR